MCAKIDNRRLREVGADLARSLYRQGRPRDEQSARFWAPAFRAGYDEEAERLGVCSRDDHDWRPGRVTSESPAPLLRVRNIGRWISTCARCGVWRDRLE